MTSAISSMMGSSANSLGGASASAAAGSMGGPLGSGLLSGLTSSTTLAGMQAASSVAGMMGAMASGDEQQQEYNSASKDAALEGTGALVAGAGQVAGLRTNLMQTLGQRQAQAGASGVDVGQGTVADTRNVLGGRADVSSGLDLTGAQIMNRKYQINSLNDQLMGNYAKENAGIQVAGDAAQLGVSAIGAGLPLIAPLMALL